MLSTGIAASAALCEAEGVLCDTCAPDANAPDGAGGISEAEPPGFNAHTLCVAPDAASLSAVGSSSARAGEGGGAEEVGSGGWECGVSDDEPVRLEPPPGGSSNPLPSPAEEAGGRTAAKRESTAMRGASGARPHCSIAVRASSSCWRSSAGSTPSKSAAKFPLGMLSAAACPKSAFDR